jgi:hypothetical protein
VGVIAEQLGHADTHMTEKHYAVADTIRVHFPTLGVGAESGPQPTVSRAFIGLTGEAACPENPPGQVLGRSGPGLRFNEHLEHDDGETIFRHACRLGLEGIVSKRKDSPYRSGRSPDWLKMKNPACAAVKREAEEDWAKSGWR